MDRYDRTSRRYLGSGSFGQVWRVDKIDELTSERRTIALKIVRKSVDGGRLSQKELKALTELAQAPNYHENIIQFYGHYQSPSHSYFEFEYVEGNLGENMQAGFQSGMVLPENTIALIASGILKGLIYMHKKGYVHGDLKPENILVSRDFRKLKIADFGSTIRLTSGRRFIGIQEIMTTFHYAGSEIFDHVLAYTSDLWSLGVIVFELCFQGQHPFGGERINDYIIRQRVEARYMNLRVMYQNEMHWHQRVNCRVGMQIEAAWKHLVNNPILWPEKVEAWNKYSDARAFIERLLEKNHEHRCTSAQALKDKFIRRALPGSDNHREPHRQSSLPQYQRKPRRQHSQYQPQPLAQAQAQSHQRPPSLWQPQNIPQQQFLQAPQQSLSVSGHASSSQQSGNFGLSYSSHGAGRAQNQSGYGGRQMTDPMKWRPKKPSLLKSVIQAVVPNRYPQGLTSQFAWPPSNFRKSRWN